MKFKFIKIKLKLNSKGWDWYNLIRFIKRENPAEYDRILKAVKMFADCLALSQIPI